MSRGASRCPPRAGWLVAGATTLGLIALLSLSVGPSSIDTASIDLRHRWIVLTGSRDQPPIDVGSPPVMRGRVANRVGVNAFLEQEVEPAKRQRSASALGR